MARRIGPVPRASGTPLGAALGAILLLACGGVVRDPPANGEQTSRRHGEVSPNSQVSAEDSAIDAPLAERLIEGEVEPSQSAVHQIEVARGMWIRILVDRRVPILVTATTGGLLETIAYDDAATVDIERPLLVDLGLAQSNTLDLEVRAPGQSTTVRYRLRIVATRESP